VSPGERMGSAANSERLKGRADSRANVVKKICNFIRMYSHDKIKLVQALN